MAYTDIVLAGESRSSWLGRVGDMGGRGDIPGGMGDTAKGEATDEGVDVACEGDQGPGDTGTPGLCAGVLIVMSWKPIAASPPSLPPLLPGVAIVSNAESALAVGVPK